MLTTTCPIAIDAATMHARHLCNEITHLVDERRRALVLDDARRALRLRGQIIAMQERLTVWCLAHSVQCSTDTKGI